MQKQQFRVYRNPKKYINNDFQLQMTIKKNPKTLKGLECKETSPYDSSVIRDVSENPKLDSFVKLMKKNKSMSSLDIHIEKSRLTNLQKIFLALKNLQSLSALQLYYPKNIFILLKVSRSFTLCTKSLKNLTNIDHHLYGSIKVASPRRALHYLIPFRRLSHFSLSQYFVNWFTDLTWRSFSYHLLSFTSLTSLKLSFSFGKEFSLKSAFYLFSAFKNLPLLTSLDLTTYDCGSSEFTVLRSLFENLKDLSHFQDLNLSLRYSKNLKPEDHNLLARGLALLNLRKLSLELFPAFSDSDLSELLVVIQRFSLLTSISLRLADNGQVTANGLTGLPATFSQIPALQGLNLAINTTMKTDSFFEIVSLSLENLKELVSFKIWTVNSKEIDNLGVQRLCSQLSSLPKLEELDLSLGSDSRLDEKCIEGLSQALRDLSGLKSLSLDWKNDEKITNKDYEGFIESLGCLKHLEELALEVPVIMDQEMLEKFCASVKSLEHLNSIYLVLQLVNEFEEEEFHGYGYIEPEIYENYCDDFFRILESLEALTEVTLYFEGFLFSEKSKRIVAKSLKNFRLCN